MRMDRVGFPPDEDGRTMDRIAGLEKIISPEYVRQALAATGRVGQRLCRLNHEVVLWLVLAMGLFTDVSIRQVFKRCRRLRGCERTPSRSSLCLARQRLGPEPLAHLFGEVVRPLATPTTPGAFYKGMRLMGIDGVVLDVPDTPANEAKFGRPSGGNRGDGAFPQVRKVSLVELGTHAELAFEWQPYNAKGGEKALVPLLLDHLPADSLLLEDRGFFSYDLWKLLEQREIKVLARVSSSLTLQPIKILSDGSYLAKIYRNSDDRKLDRKGIVVRVIAYTIDDPQRTGHGEKHRLITNLLDADAYPAMELIVLYHERWEEELVFDEQKTHQNPRRPSKPAHLRSQTPDGVIQELYTLSLGHYVIRTMMAEAAAQEGLDPDRLSFTGCFQILTTRLPELASTAGEGLARWYRGLLKEMSQERLEPRRNRINPRVIKRKMSKWLKKRPEHRRPPQLKKQFQESVLMAC